MPINVLLFQNFLHRMSELYKNVVYFALKFEMPPLKILLSYRFLMPGYSNKSAAVQLKHKVITSPNTAKQTKEKYEFTEFSFMKSKSI